MNWDRRTRRAYKVSRDIYLCYGTYMSVCDAEAKRVSRSSNGRGVPVVELLCAAHALPQTQVVWLQAAGRFPPAVKGAASTAIALRRIAQISGNAMRYSARARGDNSAVARIAGRNNGPSRIQGYASLRRQNHHHLSAPPMYRHIRRYYTDQ